MTQRRHFIAQSASLGTLAVAGLPGWSKEFSKPSSASFELPPLATDCHTHVFEPAKFPYSANRRYTPPPATVDELLRLHDSLGIKRVVIVQPSVYGTDNSCLVAAVKRLGSRARGVAVIDQTFTRGQLEDLISSGVRGVRLNLEVGKNTDSQVATDRINRTAEQIAGLGLFLQVYASLSVLLGSAQAMSALPFPVLIDHFGLAKSAPGVSQPGFSGLLHLLVASNVYMKLSGPYQISNEGPSYADIAPIAQALVQAAPDRVVWGSDWPHPSGSNRPAHYKPTDIEPFRDEDDRRSLNLVADWTTSAEQRRKLFVDNPARLFGFQ